MTFTGEPAKRYYVVAKARFGLMRRYALVEGTPDALRPDNADKDGRDGPSLFEMDGEDFWAAVNAAGFSWVQRHFKRYWVWEPATAARAVLEK